MSTRFPPAADVAAVILAAGRGTRFKSDVAKVLHRAAGRTLLRHVIEALRPLGLGQIVVVVGHQEDEVRAELERVDLEIATVLQDEPRGTGDAVRRAMPALAEATRRVMVLPGDTPLLTPEALAELIAMGTPTSPLAMLTTLLDDPAGYGRVVRRDDGTVDAVVEHADASGEQLAIGEVNAGMYVAEREVLADALDRLDDDNSQGEIYLPDIVGIARADGLPVEAVPAAAEVVAGVNDRRQLAQAGSVLRLRHLDRLMVDGGVTVMDPAATYVDVDVEVGRDTTLLPGTILESGTRVGRACVVGPDTHLTGCEIGDSSTVHSTRGVDSVVGEFADVGPFAHLRAGTRLGDHGKVGAYVETKNADIGRGTKLPHLAYVGDAVVGMDVNVSCGVITVNYDGVDKHTTTLADGAFVGCDAMLVAPVTVGEGAYVAAGSTITDDVPAGALAIARARQVVKEGWVERRRQERERRNGR